MYAQRTGDSTYVVALNEHLAVRRPRIWERLDGASIIRLTVAALMVACIIWWSPNVVSATVECVRDEPLGPARCTATVNRLLAPTMQFTVEDAKGFRQSPDGIDREGYCTSLSDGARDWEVTRPCMFGWEEAHRLDTFIDSPDKDTVTSMRISDSNWGVSTGVFAALGVAAVAMILWGSQRRRDIIWLFDKDRDEFTRVHTSIYTIRTEKRPLSSLGSLGIVRVPQPSDTDDSYALAFRHGDGIPPAFQQDARTRLDDVVRGVNGLLEES